MDITEDLRIACTNRFEGLVRTEADAVTRYTDIFGAALASLGPEEFSKRYGREADVGDPPWTQELALFYRFMREESGTQTYMERRSAKKLAGIWESVGRTVPTPRDDFERRCMELGKLDSLHCVALPSRDRINSARWTYASIRLEEELFLTQSFPERLHWCQRLASSLAFMLTLHPREGTEVITATESDELSLQHETLKMIGSGAWGIEPVLRFTESLLDPGKEAIGERRPAGLLHECIYGHAIVAGARKELVECEDASSEYHDVTFLIGYLGHRTASFHELLPEIAELPSNPATERLKKDKASREPLQWPIVRCAALSFADEVGHLMTSAMNEEEEALVEALLAIKRHAQVLARLNVDRGPKEGPRWFPKPLR